MKIFLLVLITLAGLVYADDECPEDKQIRCVDDFRAAYPVCEKAAKTSDIPATLECLKYYTKMRSECWPCICMIAEQEHVTIQGC